MRGSINRRLVVVAAAAAAAVVGCSDDRDGRDATATSRSRPSIAPPVSSDPADGAVLKRESTDLITPAEPETRQIDAESGCRTFVQQPDGACEIVMMEGGNALWTVEAEPALVGADERVWSVRVWVRSEVMPDGGWQVGLQLPEAAKPADQVSFAHVAVQTADVTGDGLPELLVGYRSGGTGQFESYDVLTYERRKPLRVAFHREGLHQGSVTVDGTSVVDYSADESSAECCPELTTRTTIGFVDGKFRISSSADVPIDDQPPDLFTT